MPHSHFNLLASSYSVLASGMQTSFCICKISNQATLSFLFIRVKTSLFCTSTAVKLNLKFQKSGSFIWINIYRKKNRLCFSLNVVLSGREA